MKKMMMLLAVALLAGTGAFAQKQFAGAKTLEVDFTPLGGSPIGLNQIKVRSFTTETTALRLGVFIGFSSDKTVTQQEGVMEIGDDSNPLLQDTDSEFTLNLRPGYEVHFAGTERLSPYVGGEALIGFSRMANTQESWNQTNFTSSGVDSPDVWDVKTTDGTFTLGLNAIAGCDFYFANSIYLGFEFGFGLALDNQLKTKTEFSSLDAYSISLGIVDEDNRIKDQPDDAENGSTFNIGPNVNGGIRLGFAF